MINWTIFILLWVSLFQFGHIPCIAHENTLPKAGNIDTTRLKVGWHIGLVYYTSNGEKATARGYIKAVGEDSITIGMGLWKEEVPYRNIVIMRAGPSEQDMISLIDLSHLEVLHGARVRVHSSNNKGTPPEFGTFVSIDADTLVLKSNKGWT